MEDAKNGFEPRIIVFACNWCSYAGADNAGVSRFQYPPNVKLIRTMCSGRVNPSFILKAFFYGADGVLVTGCHLGDCHYISGNEKAIIVVDKTKELIDLLGIGRDRLHLEWISAAEGAKFARVMTDFTERIRRLGRLK
jgi:F420-non-reducing hydrogenase iron-sulfur subunit